VEYTPFGEVVNEYNSDWSNGQVPDFKFNGKELDEESGMYYFEARYQSPPVFISRDVLFEKYPMFSPYSYCANNPLNFIDPDGKFAISIHKNITRQAMAGAGIVPKTSSFFHRDLVWGATIGADVLGAASDWHFDGRANYSAVQARWSSLNNDIATTSANIGGGNKLLGGSDVRHLGKLIHNVQDFYAHSNYVELYIEYYQGANDGMLPTSVPIYDDGVKNADFNSLLKDRLRTGDFHITDNEKIDINPFREHANSPTSHNKMNKDNANTYAGKLAKQAAINHTTKILKEVE
jgi:RHS repeat-associated protein